MRKNFHHQLSPIMMIIGSSSSLLLLCLTITTCLAQETTTTIAPSNVTESSSLPIDATTPQPVQDGSDSDTDTSTPPSEQSANDDDVVGSNNNQGGNDNEQPDGADSQQQPKVFIIHHHYNNGPSPSPSLPLPSSYADFMNRLQPVPQSVARNNQNNFDNLPQEFHNPNYPYGSRMPAQSSQNSPPPQDESQPTEEDLGRFDPLGQYSDQQKKRQFFQDLLHNQLNKFESEIEPMIEKEDNVTEKNDMEDLLGSVRDLKRAVENHQIFNITQLMDDWKEGRLQPSSPLMPSNQQSQQQQPSPPPMPHVIHQYHPRQSQPQWPPSSPSSTSAVDIPQIPPEFVPQFHPGGDGYSSGFYPPNLQLQRGFYSSQQRQQSTNMQPMPMMFQRRSSMVPQFYSPQQQFSRNPAKAGVQYTLGRSADGETNADTADAKPINTSSTMDESDDNDSNDDQQSSSLENASASPSSNAYGPEIEYQK
ncbi:uncharacterized protein LOC124490738 isoform X2 [Dermatophagoides farinae]|uniref:uncharacterized protein LOC124490738 isoform X2 n=1 Tax=Dermatophagoides farinae TaxID=6954 RepID=UPI003F5F7EB3